MSDPSKISARRNVRGGEVVVEYQRDSGRLRIVQHGKVRNEWYPPDSWFAIATASARSRWGTVPNEHDLLLVLDNVLTDNEIVPVTEGAGDRSAGV
jgi:hypothetical protein